VGLTRRLVYPTARLHRLQASQSLSFTVSQLAPRSLSPLLSRFPPAARLAADVAGVPTVLIARTDAHSASLLTSDVDEADRPFCTGKRTPEGFYYVNCGVKVGPGWGLFGGSRNCGVRKCVVVLIKGVQGPFRCQLRRQGRA
jgi:hypothetical protein